MLLIDKDVLLAVLVEVKDYYTGAVRGYGVEVHVDSALAKCVKALEVLLQETYFGEEDTLKTRSSFMNFMKISIREFGDNTDTM